MSKSIPSESKSSINLSQKWQQIVAIIIIGMGVGLLLREALHSWKIMNTQATFWLVGIAIVELGILGLILLKAWISQRSWIFWLLIGIIGIGIGPGLAECLPALSELPEKLRKSSLIMKMGILLAWIGIIILVFIKFKGKGKDRIIGVVALVVTVVGVIVAADKGLIKAVENIGENLPKLASEIDTLATHTSGIDTVLKDGIDSLVNQTKSIDTVLKDGIDSLVNQTKGIDKGIDSLAKETSSINTTLKSLVSHTADVDNTLQRLITLPLGNNADLQALRDRLTTTEKHLAEQTQQLAKISGDLESQRDDIDKIKQKLEAQNSVRLLIGSEDSLEIKDFLKKSGLPLLKSYNLSKKLSDDDPLVIMVSIGDSLILESRPQKLKLIGGFGQLDLKRLVSHLGTLKKDKDYTMVENDSTTITFINPLLGRMDVLAVVERR